MVNQFEVYLVNLDIDSSSDPKNTRPGVVISPNEVNANLGHVIIAPLASTNAKYPTRVPVEFLNAERYVILDQMRAVDKGRLVKKVGEISEVSHELILDRLCELFSK